MIKTISIDLEEIIYNTLEFVAKSMNRPIEEIIVDSLYNHVANIDASIEKAFGSGNDVAT